MTEYGIDTICILSRMSAFCVVLCKTSLINPIDCLARIISTSACGWFAKGQGNFLADRRNDEMLIIRNIYPHVGRDIRCSSSMTCSSPQRELYYGIQEGINNYHQCRSRLHPIEAVHWPCHPFSNAMDIILRINYILRQPNQKKCLAKHVFLHAARASICTAGSISRRDLGDGGCSARFECLQ